MNGIQRIARVDIRGNVLSCTAWGSNDAQWQRDDIDKSSTSLFHLTESSREHGAGVGIQSGPHS